MPCLPGNLEPFLVRGWGSLSLWFCSSLTRDSGFDFERREWSCCFCESRNPLPQGSSAADLSAEARSGVSTVEYELPTETAPATIVFCLDASVAEAELSAMKDAVEEAVGLIPEDTRVGLVTFGSDVSVHDLSGAGGASCPLAFVFNGEVDLSPVKARRMLGFSEGSQHAWQRQQRQLRFVAPVGECEFALATVLEGVRSERGNESVLRPNVATGVAAAAVCGLIEGACGESGGAGRAMFLIGSPCTKGPGKVVGRHGPMRSHREISSGRGAQAATAHFAMLAARFAEGGRCVVDVLAASLDQVGFHEMIAMPRATGGCIAMCDSFASEQFRATLTRILSSPEDGSARSGINARLDIVVGREIRVSGAMGNLSAITGATTLASENEIGVGGTTSWWIGAVDSRSSCSVFLDIVNLHTRAPSSRAGVVQFRTRFDDDRRPAASSSTKGSRTRRTVLRVTTVARPWADTRSTDLQFDQDAAAVVLARMAAERCGIGATGPGGKPVDGEDPMEIIRFLDRTLVKLVSRSTLTYPDGKGSGAAAIGLASPFDALPRLMYNLRRGPLIQAFNSSPDELAFARFCLMRASLSEALTMVQPTLRLYTILGRQEDPKFVPLTVGSIADDAILVLDTFFTVVVHVGHGVAQRQREEEQSAAGATTTTTTTTEGTGQRQLSESIRRPASDAKATMEGRVPCPKYVECTQYSGDARHLLSVLDPEESGGGGTAPSSAMMPTEDVSYSVFFSHLVRLASQQT